MEIYEILTLLVNYGVYVWDIFLRVKCNIFALKKQIYFFG